MAEQPGTSSTPRNHGDVHPIDGAGAGGRVLVVDDDTGLLRALQILLEDEGAYEVVTAPSARAALELLADDTGIRVVVTDISMPGTDGIELAREIRKRMPRVAVLLMTAHRNSLEQPDVRAAGAVDYLVKPIDPELLLASIERALRTKI